MLCRSKWFVGTGQEQAEIQNPRISCQFLYELPSKYIYKMNIHSQLKDCVCQALIYVTHKILKRVFFLIQKNKIFPQIGNNLDPFNMKYNIQKQFRIGALAFMVLLIGAYCVLHEQGIWICLWIGFPDRKWNNAPLAEGMSPLKLNAN